MNDSLPYILNLSQVYPVPAARVYALWMTEKELLKWSELEACSLDVRVGGHYRFVFHSRPGDEDITVGVYREVSARRVVFTWDGISPSGPTGETLVVFEFIDQPGGCEFRIHHEFNYEYSMIECKTGWEYWLNSLVKYLESQSDA